MTRGQTSRTDTSTLLFLSSTTEIVNRFSSLVNKADDLLVERFLVFSLCSCSFWLCPSLPYHFSSPHPLPLPTLSFSSRSFSLFSISPAPPCITSLFCPLLLPCPLLVHRTWKMGGVKLTEVVFPDGILPTLIETIQAIICHIVHQLILEENDSERTRELCARTYIVTTFLQLDAYLCSMMLSRYTSSVTSIV